LAEESPEEHKKHEKELKEFLKKIPPPAPEHTAELKMERKLKHLIEKEQKITGKKSKQK
jgi:hypothetical protein